MVSAEDQYLFDVNGFLVLPDLLTKKQLGSMNAILDQRIDQEMEAGASTHRFWDILESGQPFIDLMDFPPVMPYLESWLGNQVRLDHVYLDVIRQGLSPIGATLHGGATPYRPHHSYHVHQGSIQCALTVVAYNLHDVGANDGGFACIPGSHKANFPLPDQWRDLQEDPSLVRKVTGPGGSAVIFTEALAHGPLPWKGDHDRRTIFYKYNHHAISWSANYYEPEEIEGLTPRQHQMLEAPNARYGERRPFGEYGRSDGV